MGIERAHLVVESLNAINEAVQDTLETLTYSEATPIPAENCPARGLPYYMTSVEVKRPYTGYIRLIISRDMAMNLVASMLGCSDRMEESWVQDGLSELVNTIGGRILAHLVDTYSSFDLGIPQTVFVETMPPGPAGVLVRQAYAVNEGHVELELEFKTAQAA
jgi:CheY-specific phosphatase CheX